MLAKAETALPNRLGVTLALARAQLASGKPDDARTTVRRVLEADWSRVGDDQLRFEITATAFCHQMVRSLVGTLVAVGRGALAAADVAAILRGGDRQRCPDVAPPDGLCLWEVGYDGLPPSPARQ